MKQKTADYADAADGDQVDRQFLLDVSRSFLLIRAIREIRGASFA
jgi:hypothetical protein